MLGGNQILTHIFVRFLLYQTPFVVVYHVMISFRWILRAQMIQVKAKHILAWYIILHIMVCHNILNYAYIYSGHVAFWTVVMIDVYQHCKWGWFILSCITNLSKINWKSHNMLTKLEYFSNKIRQWFSKWLDIRQTLNRRLYQWYPAHFSQ